MISKYYRYAHVLATGLPCSHLFLTMSFHVLQGHVYEIVIFAMRSRLPAEFGWLSKGFMEIHEYTVPEICPMGR